MLEDDIVDAKPSISRKPNRAASCSYMLAQVSATPPDAHH